MKIRDILRSKGDRVITVGPGQTVHSAMTILVEHNIGALVVLDKEQIAGIITERDVLRLGARDPAGLTRSHVRDVMTTELVIGVPDDDLDYVMEIMTKNRIRHLPIVEEGRLAGMISIGDVVNACRRSAETENRYLRDYIQGVAH